MEIKTQAAFAKALKANPGGEFTLTGGQFRLNVTGIAAPILILMAGAHLDIESTAGLRVHVTAWENSTVTAWENSTVTAWGNSTVTAWENSTVTAWGNSTVTARENSTVTAWGNSTVTAWENSTVTAWGNSTVTATGYVFVRLHRARRVEVAPTCIVAQHGETPIVGEPVTVNCPAPATPEAWCNHYGVRVDGGVAYVFKGVGVDYKSPRGGNYTPGTVPRVDSFRPDPECGPGGLHFSPHPEMTLEFYPEASRFLICPVALSDIAVHPKGDYPQKIKAAGCCGPVVECDRNGKPLPVSAEAA